MRKLKPTKMKSQLGSYCQEVVKIEFQVQLASFKCQGLSPNQFLILDHSEKSEGELV